MFQTRRASGDKPLIVGHRGAPACAPENTMACFREALAQGADVIEMDVQLSADGQVVVFHDDMLERTSNGQGCVGAHTLAELQALDAGSWFAPRFAGEPIPTLEQALRWARGRAPLFIELKLGTPQLDACVVELVRAQCMQDQVALIAFDHQALRRVKQRAPELAVGALYAARLSDPVALARSIPAESLNPHWAMIEASDVARCQQAGLAVAVWGEDADYAKLLAASVDAFNADHPAQVRRDFLSG